MPLACNIDARGRALRLIGGVLVLLAGLALLWFRARPAGSALAWVVTVLLLLSGAFMIFEARAGWCVIRAAGFRTRV
jgi:uncharacterized membrane protein HdeD (DUF308 family)